MCVSKWWHVIFCALRRQALRNLRWRFIARQNLGDDCKIFESRQIFMVYGAAKIWQLCKRRCDDHIYYRLINFNPIFFLLFCISFSYISFILFFSAKAFVGLLLNLKINYWIFSKCQQIVPCEIALINTSSIRVSTRPRVMKFLPLFNIMRGYLKHAELQLGRMTVSYSTRGIVRLKLAIRQEKFKLSEKKS